MSVARKHLTTEVREKIDDAIGMVEASQRRMLSALKHAPTMAELENALEELLLKHGDDNCSVCVRARSLLEPAVDLTPTPTPTPINGHGSNGHGKGE